ncbi:unnamed protein product [Fusarium fujikuroi]|uniref:Secreted protein n=1 Tax=Fusarium fujikuroi TaxID=5127 RepID=A0A9Q9S1B7_FUSFU|nr:unnamed protein product [Fusarium fujikuroi]VTT79114.1 unnamed protein product [Fusarium fujikuroi]VZI20290.1 unnamed protein product [Fusarium fujikuroi]
MSCPLVTVVLIQVFLVDAGSTGIEAPSPFMISSPSSLPYDLECLYPSMHERTDGIARCQSRSVQLDVLPEEP